MFACRSTNPSRSKPSSKPVTVARVIPACSAKILGATPTSAASNKNKRTNLPSDKSWMAS